MKSTCGRRPTSVHVSQPLPTYDLSLLALEPRIMFDGAAAATAGTVIIDQVAQQQTDTVTSPDSATTTDPAPDSAPTGEPQFTAGDQALFDALAAYDTPMARQEIVFLSPSVRDYHHLLDGISPSVEVVVLDPTRDGVAQIAETLATRVGIDAVHVIAEGMEAELHLGASRLTQESLSATYAQQFRQIGQSLTQNADILVYGCNYGRGEAGKLAIDTLANLTGADVAASTDLTGTAGLGGDWTLEVSTGVIESDIVVTVEGQAAYGEVLDITTGLLGHWAFDSNANDSSGNNYNGVLTNGAFVDGTDATDIVGIAKLSLDGSNDYVDLTAHKGSFEFLSQGTVAMWIKTTDTSAELFSLSDTADSDSLAALWITGSGKLSFEVWEGNSDILLVDSTASVNDGQWHHVAVTVNASGNKLYIDGVQASVTYGKGNSSTPAFYDDVTGIDVVQIGRNSHSGGDWLYYNGLIDDVRVYNRALSSGDIGELHATGNDVPTITNLAGDSLAYAEGDGVVVLEQGDNATVSDVDSADFNTGTLTVSFAAGSDSAEDVLSIRHQGTGAGQIGVSGATVTYGGTTIGTMAGGSGGSNLVITLNSSAPPTAVTALVKNLTYENTDTAAPTAGARTVRIVLTDGDGGTSADYDTTVTVGGVNDAPVMAGADGTLAYTEGDGPQVLDATLGVSDADSATLTGATVTISGGFVSGEDVLAFTSTGTITGSYNAGTGVLTLTGADTPANYEAALESITYENTNTGNPNTGTRTVSWVVTDGSANSAAVTSTITVAAQNDVPVITSNGGGATTSVNVAETLTAVTDVDATDPESPPQTLAYSLIGADATRFTINTTTGVLSFLTAPDFENPTDADLNNVYQVTVQVSDGNGGIDTQAIGVTVTDVNEAPPAVVLNNQVPTIVENTVIGAGYKVADIVVIDDALGTNGLSLSGVDAASFTIVGTELFYTGPSPNFEGQASYTVTVNVDDAGVGSTPDASVNFTLTVTDVNEAPTITAIADQTIPEDATTGALAFSVSDVETAAGSLTVTATSSNTTLIPNGNLTLVDLGGGNWTITAVPAANLNGGPVTITVTVNDGTAATDETFDVTVTAQNDAPVITSDGGGATVAVNAAENQIAVTTVTSTDVDGGAPTYTIVGGADAALFAIDAATGALTFLAATDFEAPGDVSGNNVYDVTVQVSDGNGGTDAQAIAVTVTNVNEAPIAGNDATITTENTAVTTGNLLANDGDVDSVLSPASITAFDAVSVNGGTVVNNGDGSVTYTPGANFTGIDTFTYTVSDGLLSSTATVTITVTPAGNSAPGLTANTGSTVIQGLTDVITAGELQVVDLNNTPAQVSYTVTTAPINGHLELVTAPGIAITTFTQADIDSGHVVFVHSGTATTSDSFTFTVSDGAGGMIGATTFTFTVAPFIPPPGEGGGSSSGTGGSGGTGGTGSGSGLRTGSGTGSTPGRSNGVIPPPLEPAPAPMGTTGPGKEVSIVGATHELSPRTVMMTRVVARIEQPGIAVQELPKLPAEQLSPPIKKVLAVGHKLVEHLTRLTDDLKRGAQERESQTHLMGRVASFSGVALSAGFVAWILRGGSLIASFLISMPAWRRFDPLPVLGMGERDRRKRDRTVREADEQEKRQFRGLDRVLKSSDHGRSSQNRRP